MASFVSWLRAMKTPASSTSVPPSASATTAYVPSSSMTPSSPHMMPMLLPSTTCPSPCWAGRTTSHKPSTSTPSTVAACASTPVPSLGHSWHARLRHHSTPWTAQAPQGLMGLAQASTRPHGPQCSPRPRGFLKLFTPQCGFGEDQQRSCRPPSQKRQSSLAQLLQVDLAPKLLR